MLLDNLQEDYESPVPCRTFNKSKNYKNKTNDS